TGRAQAVAVDMRAAAVEFRSERHMRLAGNPPGPTWDKIAGVYRTGDGRTVRLHSNFPHHREGMLKLLGCAYEHAAVQAALREAHVFVQGYRPGGVASLGYSPEACAEIRPGIVTVSLSAYGHAGPWASRRGFDSLVQNASGINHAEAEATGITAGPKELPAQALDHATGYLMALGAMMALARKAREGGSWHVRVSLAQTAHWLTRLGRLPN